MYMYVCTFYTSKHPDPIQTDMFMHTMFALCGNRTRDLLRSWRVFPPLRQIGRQELLIRNLLLILFSLV
jgi:hypothetical protein